MRPHVVLHSGVSADGRMDWAAGDIGLYYELAGRWEVDAVLCGSNTILAAFLAGSDAAQPSEDVPEEQPTPPAKQWLVVVDGQGRIGNWPAIRRQTAYWRDVIVLCSQATPEPYVAGLRSQGIAHIAAGHDRVDLKVALDELYERYDIRHLRVDSGGILNGVLLRQGLVDEVSLLVYPELVGGVSPRSLFVAPDLTSGDGVIKLRLLEASSMRDGFVWLRYETVNAQADVT